MKMSSFKIMTKHTYKLSNNFWANNAMVLKVSGITSHSLIGGDLSDSDVTGREFIIGDMM